MGCNKKGTNFVKHDIPKDTLKSVIATTIDVSVPDKYKDSAISAVNAGINTAYDDKINSDDVKCVLSRNKYCCNQRFRF